MAKANRPRIDELLRRLGLREPTDEGPHPPILFATDHDNTIHQHVLTKLELLRAIEKLDDAQKIMEDEYKKQQDELAKIVRILLVALKTAGDSRGRIEDIELLFRILSEEMESDRKRIMTGDEKLELSLAALGEQRGRLAAAHERKNSVVAVILGEGKSL
ncbi:hypothetical protein MMC28_008910 [Mycoblastus sanguinarius]|nr:hypothetical protein [Mycoblastus sanguinarius]